MPKTLRDTIEESTDRQVEASERASEAQRQALDDHASEMAYIQGLATAENARITANAWALQAQSMAEQAERLLRQGLSSDAGSLADRAAQQDPGNYHAACVGAVAWRMAGYPNNAAHHEARQVRLIGNGGVPEDLLQWQCQMIAIHGAAEQACRLSSTISNQTAGRGRDRGNLFWYLLNLDLAARAKLSNVGAYRHSFASYVAGTNYEDRAQVLGDLRQFLSSASSLSIPTYHLLPETIEFAREQVRKHTDQWMKAAAAQDAQRTRMAIDTRREDLALESAWRIRTARRPMAFVAYLAGSAWLLTFSLTESFLWPEGVAVWQFIVASFALGWIATLGFLSIIPTASSPQSLRWKWSGSWTAGLFALSFWWVFAGISGGLGHRFFTTIGFTAAFGVGVGLGILWWSIRGRKTSRERPDRPDLPPISKVTNEVDQLSADLSAWR